MSAERERVVVVCPGRGSYTKESLAYFAKSKDPTFSRFLDDLDQRRAVNGLPTVSDLDSAKAFQPSLHTKGEHASCLIYACSIMDFMAIDRSKYEIVAITGNSMGWYSALATAGALDWASAYSVIQTMGSMMIDQIIGGQIIYPLVDERWQMSPERLEQVRALLFAANREPGAQAYVSIRLGGYVVIGGNEPALKFLLKHLPKLENYPFQLINHAAFHTPLLAGTSDQALRELGLDLFLLPHTPLIDGRGHIWHPHTTDLAALHSYTFGQQVTEVYDFTSAIGVAIKEFAPNKLIMLGPGNSLGGPVAQILIAHGWFNLSSKQDFIERQKQRPLVLSLALDQQRQLAVV